MASTPTRILVLLAAAFLASCGGDGSPGNPGPGNPGGPTPGRPPTTPGPSSPGVTDPGPSNPGMPNPGSTMPVPVRGQTDFTTEEGPGGGVGGGRESVGAPVPGSAPPPVYTPPVAPPAPAAPGAPAMAPTGRVGEVEEGDVYKIDQNRLFYFNTYRGFVTYDLTDPKKPQRLGRLPVFGYPVEMFVAGNTVYALLRDALYLSQVGEQLQFERHNVSQLVSIDVSDLRNPKLLKTIDIVGELREGVSRKIENTIYVVSYIPQSYYWGWRPDPDQQKEQATVYSFNVADPQNPKKVGEHKIFEGGSVSIRDSQGNYYDRRFQGVAISATSNALLVAENWYVSSSSRGPIGPDGGCGSYNNNQFARVSLIDISDPNGAIKLHASFETGGNLNDQFKMTYVDDPATGIGTFYGIFARQVWESAGCRGTSYTANTLESWDVSVRGQPKQLDALDFGKRNELVRASAFDRDRKVAYAITAQRIDPLYAISFADRENLSVASSIDGLSGEMSVFRLVADSKFLLAVGQDNSNACTGFQDTQGLRPTRIAVSLIDVQNLANIRLVQRQCVAVKNAEWIGSDVTTNLDQAHKMLGMHADGSLNVISVPIHYTKRFDRDDWYWYQWQTAVGLMSWDVTRYEQGRPAAQQNVIANYGTFVHPHGEVKRSVVFTHQGATPRRMMVNLSDTHISVADIQDLQNPTLESEIELAPYYNQIYRFGDYLVEQVQAKPRNFGGPGSELASFRVKKAGGDIDGAEPVASFEVGQVYRVLKHDKSLVLFRQKQKVDPRTGVYQPPASEALVVDFSNPAAPQMAGKVALPTLAVPYYRFWCGLGAYWGGFWFQDVAAFAMTQQGFAFFISEWRAEGNRPPTMLNKLLFLDVRNAAAPVASEQILPDTYEWGAFGLVADPVEPNGFYVSGRKKVGEAKGNDGVVYTRFKYYAQRWQPEGSSWKAMLDVNTPGRLIRTWKSGAGDRMFLSQDTSYRVVMEDMSRHWVSDYRLSLLRQVSVGGKPAAELLDARVLTDLYPAALLVDGDRLFINARPQKNYYYGFGGPVSPPTVVPPPPVVVAPPVPTPGAREAAGTTLAAPLPSWEMTSDRLMILDLAANRLGLAYDEPTRMYNVQLMGTQRNKLFINLAGNGGGSYYPGGGGAEGDGILVVDVSNPKAPKGVQFLRTLGFATHVEFFDADIYVASGYFGLSHLDLNGPAGLPVEPPQQ